MTAAHVLFGSPAAYSTVAVFESETFVTVTIAVPVIVSAAS